MSFHRASFAKPVVVFSADNRPLITMLPLSITVPISGSDRIDLVRSFLDHNESPRATSTKVRRKVVRQNGLVSIVNRLTSNVP